MRNRFVLGMKVKHVLGMAMVAVGLSLLAGDVLASGPFWPTYPGAAAADPDGDYDEDGLTNEVEASIFLRPTNPIAKDTDGDGLRDGKEAVPHDGAMTVKAAPEGGYAVIDLGTGYSLGGGLNDKGQVLLLAQASGEFSAKVWSNGVKYTLGNSSFFWGPTQNGAVYAWGEHTSESLQPLIDGYDSRTTLKRYNWNGSSSPAGYADEKHYRNHTRNNPYIALSNLLASGSGQFGTNIQTHLDAIASPEGTWNGIGETAGTLACYMNDKEEQSVYADFFFNSGGPNYVYAQMSGFQNGGSIIFASAQTRQFMPEQVVTSSTGTSVYNPLKTNDGYTIADIIDGDIPQGPMVSMQPSRRTAVYRNGSWQDIPGSPTIYDVSERKTLEGPYLLGQGGLIADAKGAFLELPIPPNFEIGGSGVVGRKISNNLVVPLGNSIYRNGRWRFFSELVGGTEWSDFKVGFVSPNTNLLLGDATKDGQRHRVLLVPVEAKYVNRDDATRTWWGAAKILPQRSIIYAGNTTGDMVSWKIAIPPNWKGLLNFKWTAEGPNGETIAGPENHDANEWKLADGDSDENHDWLSDEDWKPGKWKIKCVIRTISGTLLGNVELEQEIGIRTEQYIFVGSILEQPASTQGVAQSTINQYDCSALLLTGLAVVGGGINNPNSEIYFVPFEEASRVYVNYRLLNSSANQSPVAAIDAEQDIDRACGLSFVKHYRGFGAGQFRYRVDESNKLKEKPVAIKGACISLVGSTPMPCTSGESYGVPGVLHPDSGKVMGDSGATEFSSVVKFRVGAEGQRGFANVNGREIPWVFFRFRFLLDDGLLDTRFEVGPSENPGGPETGKDFSYVPTFYVYQRYYDFHERRWQLSLITTLNESRRPFFSIGNPIPGAPYLMP